MSKVTSKLQVTVPKTLADRYGITPGDDIRFEEAGEIIRVVPAHAGKRPGRLDIETRLSLFDAATHRQRAREAQRTVRRSDERGWTREELYQRGRSRPD